MRSDRVQLVVEVAQLGRARHDLPAHEVGRLQRGVAAARQEGDRVILERHVEHDALAPEEIPIQYMMSSYAIVYVYVIS